MLDDNNPQALNNPVSSKQLSRSKPLYAVFIQNKSLSQTKYTTCFQDISSPLLFTPYIYSVLSGNIKYTASSAFTLV